MPDEQLEPHQQPRPTYSDFFPRFNSYYKATQRLLGTPETNEPQAACMSAANNTTKQPARKRCRRSNEDIAPPIPTATQFTQATIGPSRFTVPGSGILGGHLELMAHPERPGRCFCLEIKTGQPVLDPDIMRTLRPHTSYELKLPASLGIEVEIYSLQVLRKSGGRYAWDDGLPGSGTNNPINYDDKVFSVEITPFNSDSIGRFLHCMEQYAQSLIRKKTRRNNTILPIDTFLQRAIKSQTFAATTVILHTTPGIVVKMIRTPPPLERHPEIFHPTGHVSFTVGIPFKQSNYGQFISLLLHTLSYGQIQGSKDPKLLEQQDQLHARYIGQHFVSEEYDAAPFDQYNYLHRIFAVHCEMQRIIRRFGIKSNRSKILLFLILDYYLCVFVHCRCDDDGIPVGIKTVAQLSTSLCEIFNTQHPVSNMANLTWKDCCGYLCRNLRELIRHFFGCMGCSFFDLYDRKASIFGKNLFDLIEKVYGDLPKNNVVDLRNSRQVVIELRSIDPHAYGNPDNGGILRAWTGTEKASRLFALQTQIALLSPQSITQIVPPVQMMPSPNALTTRP